ncbi:metallophosphoesterase family protein [Bergeyella sp. RCAD1439]|uniref:metallophosphoesterase family protein n=1 Tax=Bergeyella anatis TaxID=3113737 RepID=UPI002E1777B7|nr:metallophosphoesterase [Bergeyella sp. RCAD1439]
MKTLVRFWLLWVCFGAYSLVLGQKKMEFRFASDGTFRILQLTDVHWSPSSSVNTKNENLITDLILQEKPDLVVLSGDIVTQSPVEEGWSAIADIFARSGQRWTAVLGNHDHEGDKNKQEIAQYLEGLPFFVGYSEAVSGVLNHTIDLFKYDGSEVGGRLVLMDTHDYTSSIFFHPMGEIRLG